MIRCRKMVVRTKRMRQGHSTPPATPAQKSRWTLMREIGCIACLMNRARGMPSTLAPPERIEIHHLIYGLRIGHDATICLCTFHHTGFWRPFESESYRDSRARLGPSYHGAKKPFQAMYGSDVELLEYQNALLSPLSEKAA
jgi:hypothetical protein